MYLNAPVLRAEGSEVSAPSSLFHSLTNCALVALLPFTVTLEILLVHLGEESRRDSKGTAGAAGFTAQTLQHAGHLRRGLICFPHANCEGGPLVHEVQYDVILRQRRQVDLAQHLNRPKLKEFSAQEDLAHLDASRTGFASSHFCRFLLGPQRPHSSSLAQV